jgi:hypothetical protein
MTDSDTKVINPTVIPDQPLPGSEVINNTVSQTSSESVISGEKIPDNSLPKTVIARETISQSINTLTQKILGVYQFIEQGAIQIGKYIHGISGEVKISPDGITAKNKDGNTTVSISGDTGDATFSGEVKAGELTVVDNEGLVSLSNFRSDVISHYWDEPLTTTGPTFIEMPYLSMPKFTLVRDTRLYIYLSASGKDDDFLEDPNSGIEVAIFNGSDNMTDETLINNIFTFGIYSPTGYLMWQNEYNGEIITLPAGTYNLKMGFRAIEGGVAQIIYAQMGYSILGR